MHSTARNVYYDSLIPAFFRKVAAGDLSRVPNRVGSPKLGGSRITLPVKRMLTNATLSVPPGTITVPVGVDDKKTK